MGDRSLSGLLVLACLQAILYGGVAKLSWPFEYGRDAGDRPIVLILSLVTTCFLLYLAAILRATRSAPVAHLMWAILLPAIVFRGLLLFTPPILEIDVYRYLWDGAAASQGVNPYRYAPAQVLAADGREALPSDLQALVDTRDASPPSAEILQRIHYGELPTVYPLVSQFVFAVVDALTPAGTSVSLRVVLLKTVLLTFDVGTIVLLWKLLVAARRHPGWTICYAWCPLVLKEFANTGHLDVIAVFFTTAGVLLAVSLESSLKKCSRRCIVLCGLTVGLAIGAKLYAVVLIPLLVAAVARWRGVAAATSVALIACLVGASTVAPMLLTAPSTYSIEITFRPADSLAIEDVAHHRSGTNSRITVPTSGLTAFLSRWEMNDFLFMLVVENVRPDDSEGAATPWFAIVPNTWRIACSASVSQLLNVDARTAGFMLARALTLCVFLAIAAGLALRLYRDATVDGLLEAAFLTLAWFWLLAPTQNPWYWTWALPFLPFARGRAWLAISALAMTYYLRFWLDDAFPTAPTQGTRYDGKQFFDYVVTWFEYGPWFIWLACDWLRRGERCASTPNDKNCPSVVKFTEHGAHPG